MIDWEKCLANNYPELTQEWHPTKNGDLTPMHVSPGSNKKVWWKCSKGHEWEASVINRTRGRKCPICSNKVVQAGVNDLATTNPQVASEWHKTKNGELQPSDCTEGSSRIVWWQCKNGHEWEAPIYNRKKRGCPYCANKKLLAGYNDLATTNPSLAKEWHPTKNDTLMPNDVLAGSSIKVWWQCTNGHEWQATVINRKRGSGCPYCAHYIPKSGETDLATLFPGAAAEWHPTKNGSLTPKHVLPGSDKIVWWQCKEGHEWQAAINRCLSNNGCPFCSGRKTISGKNDIASNNAFLAREWDEKRNGLAAREVSIRSGKKYWWKCSKCGFEWMATPHNRTNGAVGTGCPQCAKETQTSYPEQVIFYFVRKHYPDAINRFTNKNFGSMELDIYIPSTRIGIEYDGARWHAGVQSKATEQRKYQICRKQGITLVRICEIHDIPSEQNCDLRINAYQHPSNEQLQGVLKQLDKVIPMEDDFNVALEEVNIRSGYVSRSKDNSLQTLYPQIAKLWDCEKNQSVSPQMVSSGSSYRAWWACEKGHRWQCSVASMVRNRELHKSSNGCPYCSGQRVIVGRTDLKTLSPELAKQWNYVKNNGLLPEQFTAQSGKKVWWICGKGHEWEAVISSRYRGNGCPYCGGKRILPGYNDFATRYPDLMEEWCCEKNTQIDPTRTGCASGVKVWWVCKTCGVSWQSTIANRIKGSCCPTCAQKRKKDEISTK